MENGFLSFTYEPQSLCLSLLSPGRSGPGHRKWGPHECCSDSHKICKKRRWIFGLLRMPAAFMSVTHIYNTPSTQSSSNAHSLLSFLKCMKNKNTPSVSEMSLGFKCQAVPVLRSSPPPHLANVQSWYFTFLDRLG